MSDEKDQGQQGRDEHAAVTKGPVLAVGGAEEKDGDSHDDILKRFLALAGDGKAAIVVIPTASGKPEQAGQKYTEVFTELGAKSVEVLDVRERADANAEPAQELIEKATGIFITGGSQARLVDLLVGTQVMETVRRCNARGVVVAGTSAGASVLASHMILGGTGLAGDSGEAAARKHMAEMVAGAGLLEDVIVDQHFSERGRIGRLLSLYAASPGLLSVGLDEDTAVLVSEGMLESVGNGMVTIMDGRDARSDYFEREVGEVLTVADSHLTVLGSGRRFDLGTRRAVMDGMS